MAEAELNSLEAMLSVTKEKSEIAKVNAGAGNAVKVSEETAALVKTATRLSAQTGGLFDVSVYPLVRAWGFTTGKNYIPTDEELSKLRQRVDYRRIEVSNAQICLEEGMGIDLGGIAKGYAAQKIADRMKEMGVASAVISLGGNVQTLGSRPGAGAFVIGVQDPADTSKLVGTLELKDQAAITSGAYQRYFEEGGVRYHHIIDPRTGRPAQSDLLSVTVICQDGTRGDALSTALYIMGEQEAIRFWKENKDFEAVFVTADGRVAATQGAAFTPQKTAYQYETIKE